MTAGDLCHFLKALTASLHAAHAEELDNLPDLISGVLRCAHISATFQLAERELLRLRRVLLQATLILRSREMKPICCFHIQPDRRIHAEHALELQRGLRLEGCLAEDDFGDELCGSSA